MDKDSPALTYKDVLLKPKRSPLSSRREANLDSRFTRNVELSVPFVSSNMATVTEHETAIAMAREGGIGVIHQFIPPEKQAEQIEKVKRSTSYIIHNPITVDPDTSLKQAQRVMRENDITSVLVEKKGKLKGIMTRRDYIFEDDSKTLVEELMTPRSDLVTADPGIELEEAKKVLFDNRIEKLPLVEDNEIKGLITGKDIKKLEHWPQSNRDKQGKLRVAAAVGVSDALQRSEVLVESGVDVLVLDIAHGHSDMMINTLEEMKNSFDIDVMAGNIATKEGAEDLINAGADGLKVGIGPSPVCTTRVRAGAGVPQFSAVKNVAEYAQKQGVPITADGGMRYPGDAAKAIAAGASSIYSGFFFAGTDEAPGRIIFKDGRRYKKYIGSASYENNHKRKERKKDERIKERLDVFVEGVSSLVDYKGSVADVISSLKKGVQSSISYCGAEDISEMQENSEFVRITASGWQESKSRGKEERS
ncbi:MAG: IMP dehydrogenase [Candidatus Magasanikbacteria bacterium]